MKILLTGATGFLGQVIKKTLEAENSEVITLSRNNCMINCDLSTHVPKLPDLDIVVHAAGKAHSVPKAERHIQVFWNTNVSGTVNLLSGLEQCDKLPKSFVFISSVSVYGKDTGTKIKETAPLAAADTYGKNKIEAERIIQAWCSKNDVICTILRLPLVAGPNPPGNLMAMINGLKRGYYVNITGGKARKSMVMAEDVASIIIKAAQVGGIYNLTDGYHPSFYEISRLIAKQLGKGKPANIPDGLAKIFSKVGDLIGPRAPINSSILRKITSALTFDDSKAREYLGWKPRKVLEAFKIKSVR